MMLLMVMYLGKTSKPLLTMCTMSTTAVTTALCVEAWPLSNFPIVSLGELEPSRHSLAILLTSSMRHLMVSKSLLSLLVFQGRCVYIYTLFSCLLAQS